MKTIHDKRQPTSGRHRTNGHHRLIKFAIATAFFLISNSAAALLISVSDDTPGTDEVLFREFEIAAPGTIKDVNVTIDFAWDFPAIDAGQLVIFFGKLDPPSPDDGFAVPALFGLFSDSMGDPLEVWPDAAGVSFDGIITFDESAATRVDEGPPASGTFRSIDPSSLDVGLGFPTTLDRFNGVPLAGTWGLTIFSFVDEDLGAPVSLRSVTLDFHVAVPQPITLALLGVGVVAVGFARRYRHR